MSSLPTPWRAARACLLHDIILTHEVWSPLLSMFSTSGTPNHLRVVMFDLLGVFHVALVMFHCWGCFTYLDPLVVAVHGAVEAGEAAQVPGGSGARRLLWRSCVICSTKKMVFL